MESSPTDIGDVISSIYCLLPSPSLVMTLSNDRAHQILWFHVGDLAMIQRKKLNGSLCQVVCDPNTISIVDKLPVIIRFIPLFRFQTQKVPSNVNQVERLEHPKSRRQIGNFCIPWGPYEMPLEGSLNLGGVLGL